MRAHGGKVLKFGRRWLLCGSVLWTISCGADPAADDGALGRSSAFSESACGAVSAPDAAVGAFPDFSVTSPANYNSCDQGYVVWVNFNQQTFTPNPQAHQDAVVSYVGTVPVWQGECERLNAAAYFYTSSGTSYASSWGVWLPSRQVCIPPAVNLRDFKQYITVPGLPSRISIAATMRDHAQNALPVKTYTTFPLKVASVQSSVQAPTGCSSGASYMLGGEGLFTNQALYSCDGRFRLYMQGDGNLVLSQKDSQGNFSIPLWTTRTNGVSQANLLLMGTQGNLEIYSIDGTPIWFTETGGKPGLHLKLFNDGNMKLYDGAYGTVWQTNTGGH